MGRPRYACPLWSKSGQTRVQSDHPLNATHDCDPVADSKMGSSNWAIMEKSANKCVVSRFFAPRARRSLQRLIGDFVSEHLFFGLVESYGGVAHSSDPSVGQQPIKGPCISIIVIIDGAA